MLKELALGIAAGLFVVGAAAAQTPRLPALAPAVPTLLVKHDGKHDNGQHLGWYKHHGGEDEDEQSSRNRSTTAPYGYYPTPGSYYAPPGYGSSYPPAYYRDYGPPH